MTQIGKLRHRVTIQTVTESHDTTTGNRTPTYTDKWTNVPAQRMDQRASEFIQAGQTIGDQSVVWIIRHRDGINTSSRVVDADGTNWGVEAITNPDQRKRFLHLMCRNNAAEV